MQDQHSDHTPTQTDEAAPAIDTESTTPSKKKISTASLIGIISTIVILLGTGIFVYIEVMSKITTRSWRQSGTELPWETEHFTLAEVETGWKSSEGDARMQRRFASFPLISLTLEDIKKNGKLMISFHDEDRQRQGDITTLPFTTQGFEASQDYNTKVEGNKVTFYPLCGYKLIDDYLLHQVDYHAPLWTIEVRYLIDGDKEPQLLGKTGIYPNKLGNKQD